jgi:hypothetical protein
MDNKAYEQYQAQQPVTMPVRIDPVESDWNMTNTEIIICVVIALLVIYAGRQLFRKKS